MRNGSIAILTDDAAENYGEEWRGVKLRITDTSTKYMPASKYFPSMPRGYHPGYDESNNCLLYELEVVETGEEFPGSLYQWELEPV